LTELFLRKAVVTIGPAGSESTVGAAGTSFDGFRVAFEIDKTSESSPNPGKISIYNLQKSSRASLEQGQVCFLEAGYTGLGGSDPVVARIYTGDVRWFHTERNGPDLVTTMECGDAEVALRGVHVEQAFGPGTTAAQVISYLTGQLGLSIGTIVPAVKGVFQHGISISGLASDALDHVTEMAGLEWHVTDGEVNVLEPNVPTDDTPILVAASTGLIGYPSKNQQDIVFFKSLLNPHLRPGVPVLLNSETYSGLVRCRLCKFRGDTHGGEFSVSVEAYPL
jgi:hypothetical protein